MTMMTTKVANKIYPTDLQKQKSSILWIDDSHLTQFYACVVLGVHGIIIVISIVIYHFFHHQVIFHNDV